MALTYQAVNGRVDCELAVAPESIYGTFTQASAVQIPHAGMTWTRGHQPIEARAATSTTQHAIEMRSIRGMDTPRVSFTAPFSDNAIGTVFRMIFGGTLAAGTWPIADALEGWSFTVGASSKVWEFSGGRMESAQILLPVGAPAELTTSWIFHGLVDPDSASAFPTLTPTIATSAYALQDVILKSSDTSTFSGNAIPIQGVSLNITRGTRAVHSSGQTTPNSVLRGSIDITGSIDFAWSTELQDDFEDLVASEGSVGYSVRYLQFTFADAASNSQTLALPCKLDWSDFSAPGGDDPVTVAINFVAGGSNATPTDPVALVKDVT